MSGICAVWRKRHPAELPATLTAIGGGLAHAHSEQLRSKERGEAGVAVSAALRPSRSMTTVRRWWHATPICTTKTELRSLGPADMPELRRGANRGAIRSVRIGFSREAAGQLFGGSVGPARRKLTAAVDRFGVIRLVYFENRNVLLIGSRIDALMRSGEIPADVNPQAIANFMNWGVNLAPDTIFRGVRRLPPACRWFGRPQRRTGGPLLGHALRPGGERVEERLSRQLEPSLRKFRSPPLQGRFGRWNRCFPERRNRQQHRRGHDEPGPTVRSKRSRSDLMSSLSTS